MYSGSEKRFDCDHESNHEKQKRRLLSASEDALEVMESICDDLLFAMSELKKPVPNARHVRGVLQLVLNEVMDWFSKAGSQEDEDCDYSDEFEDEWFDNRDDSEDEPSGHGENDRFENRSISRIAPAVVTAYCGVGLGNIAGEKK